MMAAPAVEKPIEPPKNLHAGAAAAVPPAPPPLAPKAIHVERPAAARDTLDEAAQLFKTIFKGEIVP